MTISVKGGSGIDAKFRSRLRLAGRREYFRRAADGGLMYKKYQVGNTNPDLGQMLDSAPKSRLRDRLDLKLSLTDDQMLSLIPEEHICCDHVAAQPSSIGRLPEAI